MENNQTLSSSVRVMEPNDTITTATATNLRSNNPDVVIASQISFSFANRLVDQTEDVDMYSVDLAAGDLLVLDMDADIFGSTLDPVVRLFDADGNQLAQSDDNQAPDEIFGPGGLDSYLEYTVDAAGTYYVGISSWPNAVFDYFEDDQGNPTNVPYDPNIAASGTGESWGDYELNALLNQELVPEPTDIPPSNGRGPTISLLGTAGTYDSEDNLLANALVQNVEDGASVLTLGLAVEGFIPPTGREVFLTSDADLRSIFQTGQPYSPGSEVLGAVFDDNGVPIGLRVQVFDRNSVVLLPLANSEETGVEAPDAISFNIEPSAGYVVGENNSTTAPIFPTLDDVPELPTVTQVGISLSETELVESLGNATTLSFELTEAPPSEGIIIHVDSGVPGALGELDVLNAEVNGGAFPSPNFNSGGFFFRITEASADITLSAFDDGIEEGVVEYTYTIQPGVGYTIDPQASEVTFTIADNPNSVPLPPDNGDDNGDGDNGIPTEAELNDTIATANPISVSLENPSFTLSGAIDSTEDTSYIVDRSEDVDMFAFELEVGQTLMLDVDTGNRRDSLLSPVVRIFDGEGAELASRANRNASLEFIAPETGTYYAGISQQGNDFYDPNVVGSGSGWTIPNVIEPGSYTLDVNLQAA
ncbi:DVUA0089 family protein [Gloeocapsa sp. PCC 73106]|uniref:DVUA0089 family protein n=1 Tax=Gloeocapsa sp. PCC 73106 TaxID=102232 RepID=UPI0005579402|nr:DVUA0089 family protein [Gloeocapsa sp. PCC 73106]